MDTIKNGLFKTGNELNNKTLINAIDYVAEFLDLYQNNTPVDYYYAMEELNDRIAILAFYLKSNNFSYPIDSKISPIDLISRNLSSTIFFRKYFNVVKSIDVMETFFKECNHSTKKFMDNIDILFRSLLLSSNPFTRIEFKMKGNVYFLSDRIKINHYFPFIPVYMIFYYLFKSLKDNSISINTYTSTINCIQLDVSEYRDTNNFYSSYDIISNVYRDFNSYLNTIGYYFLNITTKITDDENAHPSKIFHCDRYFYPFDITVKRLEYFLRCLGIKEITITTNEVDHDVVIETPVALKNNIMINLLKQGMALTNSDLNIPLTDD